MSKNIDQIFIANPASSMVSTDLFYLGRSPFGPTNDMAITWANVLSSVQAQATGTWSINISGNAATVTTNANLTGDVTSVGNATTLATVNSNVGTFGDGTHVGQFTVNGKGLITAASSVAITGAPPTGTAGGDLSGSYPNPSVVKINGVSLGTTTATAGNLLIGSGTQWVTQAVSGDATLAAGGALTLATVNSNVGTFGDGTHVGTFTVNAKGLITAASSTAITGAPPTGTAGGDLSGSYPNPTVAKINGVTLGSLAATSGNILIGNGTNYISSTSLWPNTVGSVGKIIRSDGTTNAYTTSTFADTYAVSTILYASSANTVTGLATANNSVLATNGSGVPSLTTSLPSAVQVGVNSLNSGTSASSSTFWRGDGTWAAAGSKSFSINVQVFTSSGTYTPTANMVNCIIEGVGGGGGGGGAANAAGNECGGGGGAGGYSRHNATAADIGASKTVTIGAAGTGGAAGNNAGGNGGDTSVGTLMIAKGGSGGAGQASGGNQAAGGAGGVAGTGNIVTLTGSNGDGGVSMAITTVQNPSGAGGVSYFGGGAGSTQATVPGAAGGTNTGSGGSGGAAFGSTGAVAGGNGGAGLVIITEYIYG